MKECMYVNLYVRERGEGVKGNGRKYVWLCWYVCNGEGRWFDR